MLKFGAMSWDYRSKPEEFQKRQVFSSNQWEDIAESFKASGYVVLSTCNRIEFYFTFEDQNAQSSGKTHHEHIMLGNDALLHLFMVAAGLKSMSVGENEILAQVKSAFDSHVKAGRTDKLLSLIFRKAISVGKEVREKTGISRGKTSIPVIAVDLAGGHLDFPSSKVSVIGTGQMAETFLKYLQKRRPASMTVVGRNQEKASQLASVYNCNFGTISSLQEIILDSNAVFCATSSRNVIVTADMVNGKHRPQVVVDISNPRNIDTELGKEDAITVYDLEHIQEISQANSGLKKEEIPRAQAIVNRELQKFEVKLAEFRADELLTKSYTFAESIALREINRMMKEIAKGMDPGEATRKSASAMVNKILGNYTTALREAAIRGDKEMIAKLQAIFQ
ncbi:MAG: glutamyl-tRNA reductase [Candidatus Thermoplasmatota archaeon]|nr:glutamyl-tRNA reductase [Candidatus Thermoplasmatota archaeon]